MPPSPAVARQCARLTTAGCDEATNERRRTRASGGYPVSIISGKSARWAPASAARRVQSRTMRALPSMSPTVGLTWASATRSCATPPLSRSDTASEQGRLRVASMERQQEFVLRTIEERDIRFVRLWFTDVLGFLKSVAVAPAELEGAFAEGIGFDGSAIEGFARVHESDMLARPDP